MNMLVGLWEADLPVLFLVLVVLPLVAYILHGKWSETTKKREKIDLLAQLTTEEALKAEAMPYATATAPAIPFVYPSNNGIHGNQAICNRIKGGNQAICIDTRKIILEEFRSLFGANLAEKARGNQHGGNEEACTSMASWRKGNSSCSKGEH
ncbi:hypothetical protein GH714_013818 [Hevea brasiliensis]|uniref:Uncharacterized protein n=1 Tax=Hevea brasiliensis TaxID=3981 RepID=A0A6A6KEH1_HEVBR|nr:hypothetical protein GH714_013818 [Hevea brasiliensis]